MLIVDIIRKFHYWFKTDRIGPDIPLHHWKLYFKSTMFQLCRSKFRRFGKDAEFRPGAFAVGCSKIEIGDRVIIRPGTMLFGESELLEKSIIIDDYVMLGSGIHIYINNHRFDNPSIPIIDQGYYPDAPVWLKEGCWIGANSILLPGVTIGRNSVVGAGSIVLKSIPDGVLAVGSPARVVRKLYESKA